MGDDFKKLRAILQKVDFLNSLKFHDLDLLINSLKKRQAKKGETIIKQGNTGDAFFLLSSGSVSIYKKGGMMGGSKKVAGLSSGDFFGETALVTNEPRTATVTADEPTELFVLYKNAFKKILLANPEISVIINSALAKRKSK